MAKYVAVAQAVYCWEGRWWARCFWYFKDNLERSAEPP